MQFNKSAIQLWNIFVPLRDGNWKSTALCSGSRGFISRCNRETVNALNIYLSRIAYNAIDHVLHVLWLDYY